MALCVGDLVAEDHTLYWNFYNKSYTFISEESDPSQGEPEKIIGIITPVHKRFPDAFFEIPYYVYKIKWLNSPHGVLWDDKFFYEDELILLSRVCREGSDPEYEENIEYDEEEGEEE